MADFQMACMPPGDTLHWVWWHWLEKPLSEARKLDCWNPAQRCWGVYGNAIGWRYLRPATITEVERRVKEECS